MGSHWRARAATRSKLTLPHDHVRDEDVSHPSRCETFASETLAEATDRTGCKLLMCDRRGLMPLCMRPPKDPPLLAELRHRADIRFRTSRSKQSSGVSKSALRRPIII